MTTNVTALFNVSTASLRDQSYAVVCAAELVKSLNSLTD